MSSVKKVKSKGRTSAAKAKVAPKNVDEYMARVPEPASTASNKVRAAIRSAVPKEAVEVISYRMPAFKHKKVLVWFAAFSGHCSLFPTASVIEAFNGELAGFSTSKGTIHFPINRSVPTSLIKKLVKARVAQSESKR
ncbi:MAG: iron chaperone [Terriglobales bacterium]